MIRRRAKANVHSAELEMTVNMLIQIDKLVQLLESPVFTCMSIIWRFVWTSLTWDRPPSAAPRARKVPTFVQMSLWATYATPSILCIRSAEESLE